MLFVSSARATTSPASGSIATPSIVFGCAAAASAHASVTVIIKNCAPRIISGSSRKSPITSRGRAPLSTRRRRARRRVLDEPEQDEPENRQGHDEGGEEDRRGGA